MPAFPPILSPWASNANYASGPDAGHPTKVDPGSGVYPDGHIPGAGAPAAWRNFLDAAFVAWIATLTNAAVGTLQWSGRLESVGGTDVTPAVTVDPIELLVTDDGYLSSQAAHTYVIGDYDPALSPITQLAAQTPYYCYVSIVSGTAKYFFSVTGPVAGSGAGIAWQTGQVGHARYLGCFLTDFDANPIPFRASRGRYVYRRSALTPSLPGTCTVTNSYATTAWNDLILGTAGSGSAPLIPPHARMALLDVQASNSNTSALEFASFRTKETSDTFATTVLEVYPAALDGTTGVPLAGPSGVARMPLEIETDASQTIQVDVSSTNVTLTVVVAGFVE